ncbi:unnamed protein product [Linum trigynum]|uniref:Uncharacterized protein n=1 Tax=Linum trigynum TaxID=586398 RepID=A0AAV2GQH7_9ROSI
MSSISGQKLRDDGGKLLSGTQRDYLNNSDPIYASSPSRILQPKASAHSSSTDPVAANGEAGEGYCC